MCVRGWGGRGIRELEIEVEVGFSLYSAFVLVHVVSPALTSGIDFSVQHGGIYSRPGGLSMYFISLKKDPL